MRGGFKKSFLGLVGSEEFFSVDSLEEGWCLLC